MNRLFIILIILSFCKLTAQEYDFIETTSRVNSITLRKTTQDDLLSNLIEPNEIEEDINVIGEEENLRRYYFNNSYFECWDGFVQSFLIKNEGFRFNDKFEVGDNINVLENFYPKSFSNPLDDENISEYDKSIFDFDSVYWVDSLGDEGLLIFCKNGIIIGFRYLILA